MPNGFPSTCIRVSRDIIVIRVFRLIEAVNVICFNKTVSRTAGTGCDSQSTVTHSPPSLI
jgi:hypothetical protein